MAPVATRAQTCSHFSQEPEPLFRTLVANAVTHDHPGRPRVLFTVGLLHGECSKHLELNKRLLVCTAVGGTQVADSLCDQEVIQYCYQCHSYSYSYSHTGKPLCKSWIRFAEWIRSLSTSGATPTAATPTAALNRIHNHHQPRKRVFCLYHCRCLRVTQTSEPRVGV